MMKGLKIIICVIGFSSFLWVGYFSNYYFANCKVFKIENFECNSYSVGYNSHLQSTKTIAFDKEKYLSIFEYHWKKNNNKATGEINDEKSFITLINTLGEPNRITNLSKTIKTIQSNYPQKKIEKLIIHPDNFVMVKIANSKYGYTINTESNSSTYTYNPDNIHDLLNGKYQSCEKCYYLDPRDLQINSIALVKANNLKSNHDTLHFPALKSGVDDALRN